MRPIPGLPPGRHGVFTFAEALAAGWTASALARAVRSDRLLRLDRGLFAMPVTGDGPLEARARFAARSVAAALAARPAVASHRSSAVLATLPVWTLPERACVTVPPKYTGDAQRAHLYRATLRPGDIYDAVVRRTVAARTVVDVARECGDEEAVVIADAALRRQYTDLDRISAAVWACEGWPGWRRAERIIELVDARSESPLESVSRLRLLGAGLPTPEPQVWISDLRSHVIGRVDLYWDEFGVVGEVDGKVKFAEKPEETAFRQQVRRERLEELGLLVVRWGMADLMSLPRLTTRLESAFGRGLRRSAADRCWVATSSDPFAPLITGLSVVNR